MLTMVYFSTTAYWLWLLQHECADIVTAQMCVLCGPLQYEWQMCADMSQHDCVLTCSIAAQVHAKIDIEQDIMCADMVSYNSYSILRSQFPVQLPYA